MPLKEVGRIGRRLTGIAPWTERPLCVVSLLGGTPPRASRLSSFTPGYTGLLFGLPLPVTSFNRYSRSVEA